MLSSLKAMKLAHHLVLSALAALMTACAPQPEGAATVAAKTTAAPRTVFEVPQGAHLAVVVQTALSSKTSQVGDRIEAHLADDLVVGNKVVARAGSAVSGRVIAAVPSGRVKTRARLAFVFDALVLEGGAEQAIATKTVDITAHDTHTRDALTVGGGAGAGALIGAIVDGGKGAGLGALIGAGAGTGVVLVDKGKNINIPAGGTLSLELVSPLRIRL